ncbi:hypothetical protein FOA43_004808 [Brettanomyces nanus]|uniref:Uncharacterized protein n=1 Tax=Eeniella nana TaxID=13502 RepID=A0A875SBN6_EENNA|nr:uncharacterized protein FOA43_004808 [Brettanomyces nanus]QPG77395.1 hypothetical protein FOA43_004808 [Brettanomyces nanus]
MVDLENLKLRHRIVYAVILISAIVGLPIWYLTTSIHRAALPEEEINQMSKSIMGRINYKVPIYLIGITEPLQGLLVEAQALIDQEVAKFDSPIVPHYTLYEGDENSDGYQIKLIILEPEDDREESLSISPFSDRQTKMFISADVINNDKVPDFIMRVVTNDLFGSELEMLKRLDKNYQDDYDMVKMPYSRNYKVSLSFLEESDDPIDWDIKPVIKTFERYLAILGEYANFTVESQLGYYESLLDSVNLEREGSDNTTFILRDTSTFIDYSEWGLDQDVEVGPSINLVLYVPNSDKRIEIANSSTGSFLVPQWGGVVIRNNDQEDSRISTQELLPVFDVFASHLFRLLGAPEKPKSPFIRADILTRWQSVECLLQSVDNLMSLTKLTKQLPTIPIPEITLKEVDDTIKFVNESVSIMDNDSIGNWWKRVNQLSSKALELSDKAFFQKDMVQQVYFPEEHKMAVYMPLLGPIGTILLLGLLRIFRESREVKKEKEKEKEVASVKQSDETVSVKAQGLAGLVYDELGAVRSAEVADESGSVSMAIEHASLNKESDTSLTSLTDELLLEEMKELKIDSGSPDPEDEPKDEENPLYGTILDNKEKRNLLKAPLPKGYVGEMTDQYKPYEQIRVVKRSYGNPDKVPRATFLTLVRNSELYGILSSIQQLENRFNGKMNYDWVFLNNVPFTDEFVEMTSAMVSGTARYGIIPHEHWSYPSWISQDRAKVVRGSRKYSHTLYGSSESYRHMCRYNSRFFYRHPIMDDYELYWRVEPDVHFKCDILEDPFRYMVDTQTQYGFTIAFEEIARTVETLWSACKRFFSQENVALQLPADNLMGFISDNHGDTYNLCHFWTNFEIANLTLWRSGLYEEYVDYLDHAGGFFYERWGDAPVHSIAASLMLSRNQVHNFDKIAYQHTVAETCPLDDDLRKNQRCTCDPMNDWLLSSNQHCNRKFLKASKQVPLKDYKKYFNILRIRKSKEEEQDRRKHRLRAEAARRKAEERKRKSSEKKKLAEQKKEDAINHAEAL